jgi:hypothetical protein
VLAIGTPKVGSTPQIFGSLLSLGHEANAEKPIAGRAHMEEPRSYRPLGGKVTRVSRVAIGQSHDLSRGL